MAKRKRLSPALMATETGSEGRIEPVSRPPIATVAGESAASAGFAEVARELTEAREEGRLIQRLPLEAIETGHLVRDRVAFDGDEMAALRSSLDQRGQQVPIEVVNTGDGRYGLISGLRRVLALRDLGAAHVLALVRRPESSAEAYLAMVEENEIRAGISFYERARLAAEAARLGLYPDPAAAISALFGAASPAKRSKIGSFVRIHAALGDVLRFPAAIPERVGLALAGALDRDAGFAAALRAALAAADADTAEAERGVLQTALARSSEPAPRPGGRGRPRRAPPGPAPAAGGIVIDARPGWVLLTGDGITEALCRDLELWLVDRRTGPAGDS
jgi:ParB family chromosome partitioning protein